ncbi:MAG: hypothetical protein C5B50_06635 [Verrucomicrobia bacterium]|nr:MAG: hypothetical protein C5B50_06635 [Verrucomicrobiota bacterium]
MSCAKLASSGIFSSADCHDSCAPTVQTPNIKHQTPNTKHQAPNFKHQTPNSNQQTPGEFQALDLRRRLHGLEFGAWCFSGAWSLVFGVFLSVFIRYYRESCTIRS